MFMDIIDNDDIYFCIAETLCDILFVVDYYFFALYVINKFVLVEINDPYCKSS